jgi:hypothetical protein
VARQGHELTSEAFGVVHRAGGPRISIAHPVAGPSVGFTDGLRPIGQSTRLTLDASRQMDEQRAFAPELSLPIQP